MQAFDITKQKETGKHNRNSREVDGVGGNIWEKMVIQGFGAIVVRSIRKQ